jgi:hypothetical protein
MSALAGLDAARAVLRRYGVSDCVLRSGGVAGEVLLIAAPQMEEHRLLGATVLLQELRATGFRFVALDLAVSGGAP